MFLHIDCDSFFASCEILRDPSLKWKFVCVWDEIIIACTYNCKALGIKTWTPIWEAKKILKDNGVFLSCHHSFYEEVSQKLFRYIKDTTLSMEPFSIDECFSEITWLPEYYKVSLGTYIRILQKNILNEIWIPVSIGCADTRIKAKIYSKINKPYGIYIGFNPSREIKLYQNLEVSKIPFIGKAYTEKLQYKAHTIYSFIQIGFWGLKEIIWKNATDLRLELVWVNAFIVKKSLEEKSISRSRSFNKQITNNVPFLLEQLHIHFERVFETITEKNKEIKSISLLLRTKEFHTLVYDHVFSEHTNERKILYDAIITLFYTNYREDFLYRSVGVIFSDFRSYLPRQIWIFDTPLRSKDNEYRLAKVIHTLNTKIGQHKVSYWTSLLWKWSDTKLGFRK